jgi:hypothetical protein
MTPRLWTVLVAASSALVLVGQDRPAAPAQGRGAQFHSGVDLVQVDGPGLWKSRRPSSIAMTRIC